MSARKHTIAVIFGGRSVEHDVSIVTAQQIMRAFDPGLYDVVPVYITRDGKWLTGDGLREMTTFEDDHLRRAVENKTLHPCLLSPDVRHHGLILDPMAGRLRKSRIVRVDVAFPAIHGSHGEDGTLQGLFELADIPYVGFATLGSALTNDKILTKRILSASGIPVLDGEEVRRVDWLADSDTVIRRLMDRFAYPVFIKPATLGSSIGVGRADNDDLLRASLDIALNFDRRALVEPAVENGYEINCAVMGYGDDVRTSVLEQPLSWTDYLSFDDKYLRGSDGMKSADRIIPAPVDDEMADRIQQISIDAFRAVDGRGIVRIDFLVQSETGEVFLNEMNTMPGSLAFYLWQESGMSPSDVVDHLVKLARDAHADKRRNLYDYKTNLVSVTAGRGLKGAKGVKDRVVSKKPIHEGN